jgi:hypothetical protein
MYAQEFPAFERVRDVFSDGKFTLRSCCIEPAAPDIDPDLIWAAEFNLLPSKAGRFQIT